MSKLTLYSMKEVKVIIKREHLGYITDLLDSLGTTGYTIVQIISGRGHHGIHVSNPMTNSMENLVMLLSVMPEEKLEAVLEGLNPILDEYTGIVYVFDVAVSNKGYF
ncbi:MAG: DUF190 domain-containing protein [Deltaproteobacteria bacterium]|nr:DUF190 domain-containing protein [Deltaproteobacteria bacterium]